MRQVSQDNITKNMNDRSVFLMNIDSEVLCKAYKLSCQVKRELKLNRAEHGEHSCNRSTLVVETEEFGSKINLGYILSSRPA